MRTSSEQQHVTPRTVQQKGEHNISNTVIAVWFSGILLAYSIVLATETAVPS